MKFTSESFYWFKTSWKELIDFCPVKNNLSEKIFLCYIDENNFITLTDVDNPFNSNSIFKFKSVTCLLSKGEFIKLTNPFDFK